MALILIAIVSALFKQPPKNGINIYFLDVGQGDAILIQKDDYQILIDGGPDDKVLTELAKAMPLSDRKIEVVVLTHPHADHLVGLNLILNRYQVDQIYSSGVLGTSDQYLSFLGKIKNEKIKFAVPSKKELFVPFEQATFQFLWPGDDYKEREASNLNNSSIVAKFCYQEDCALFTGDIEAEEQEKMLDYYKDNTEILQANIYKFPHHGSSTGANDSFFIAVSPFWSIISCGKNNSYGHPNKEALDLINKNHSEVLRTDQIGVIKFEVINNKFSLMK